MASKIMGVTTFELYLFGIHSVIKCLLAQHELLDFKKRIL